MHVYVSFVEGIIYIYLLEIQKNSSRQLYNIIQLYCNIVNLGVRVYNNIKYNIAYCTTLL